MSYKANFTIKLLQTEIWLVVNCWNMAEKYAKLTIYDTRSIQTKVK